AADVDLRDGDYIKQVDSVTFEEYDADIRVQLFPAVAPGTILTMRIERDGEERTVLWQTPDVNLWEFENRLLNVWLLGLVFWLAGLSTILFVRPRDNRWLLLIAFYNITALWLTAGDGSQWVVFRGPTVMRMALWMALPIYLHLHWTFPRPLRRVPAIVWVLFYSGSLVLAALQWANLIPAGLAYLAFVVAIVGSVVLLGMHYATQPASRSALRSLAFGVSIGLLPAAILAVMSSFYDTPLLGRAGLIFLILVPLAYFRTAYRRQFAEHSLRANQAISLIIYLMLVAVLGTTILSVGLTWADFAGAQLVIGSLLLIGIAAISALAFSRFQRVVERYLLEIPYESGQVAHIYAERITRSLDTPTLTTVIQDEVLPSFLVRQSALLALRDRRWQLLYAQNVAEVTCLTTPALIESFIAQDGVYQRPATDGEADRPCAWVRLVLNLVYDGDLVGCWLLGSRDPDDFYGPGDISTLRLLANQTAVAILNAEQAERLRALYEANIDRSEHERRELANSIHDEILRNLAILNNSVPDEALTDDYEDAYANIDNSLRRLTSRLRPVMLDVGLYSALEELCDSLGERPDSDSSIHFALSTSDAFHTYPAQVQESLFRIAQNACENAIRHAQASDIVLSGELSPEQITLIIEDNGIGFEMDENSTYSTLLANKRFGLVSMYERAELIGANLHIGSVQAGGTAVEVSWRNPNAD
ncbi:MAG: hypothetical protein KDD84_16400, partial [Caldilineaceae bacterium]|nr:hypothetical protein [Caldilineaceae bacterium]